MRGLGVYYLQDSHGNYVSGSVLEYVQIEWGGSGGGGESRNYGLRVQRRAVAQAACCSCWHLHWFATQNSQTAPARAFRLPLT